MKKIKKLYLISIIVAIAVSLVILLTAFSFFPANAQNSTAPKVILDAGHGGFDGGAVAHDGTVEKDINLSIAVYTKEILKLNGFDVIMSRETDSGTEENSKDSIASKKRSDLKKRLSLMNDNPNAIFVSVHLNKFTTSAANGAQVFYGCGKNETLSKMLAQSIQQSICAALQPNNKRVIKKGNENSYLLKNATVPAIIVECGFLSNKKELELLKTEDYQRKTAFCIANGIMEFYKSKDEVSGKD